MISNHLSMVEALRPASDELAAQVAQFLEAGGTIEEGPASGYVPKPITYSNQMPPAPKPFVRRRVEPPPPAPPTKLEERIEERRQRVAQVMALAPDHSQGDVAKMTGISRRVLLNMSREFNFRFKAVPPGRHANPERINAFIELGISRRKVCGMLGISSKTFARILKDHSIDYPKSNTRGSFCAA